MGWGQNPLDGPAVPTADPLSAPRSLWDKRAALVLGRASRFVGAGSEQGRGVLLAQGSPAWASSALLWPLRRFLSCRSK